MDSSINTSYKYSEQTLSHIRARGSSDDLKHRRGNDMVFLPSFEYLDMACKISTDLLKDRVRTFKVIR